MFISNKTRPVIGVGVLVWRDQQLLLGKRLSKGLHTCWQLPGGHLEVGETVTECAQREVQEETSLQVHKLRHLGFTNQPFSAINGETQQSYITLFVSCEYAIGKAQTCEPDKCECWQWFDYRQLPSPLFEPITLFMEQLALAQLVTAQPVTIQGAQQSDLYELHRASHIMQDAPSNVHK